MASSTSFDNFLSWAVLLPMMMIRMMQRCDDDGDDDDGGGQMEEGGRVSEWNVFWNKWTTKVRKKAV